MLSVREDALDEGADRMRAAAAAIGTELEQLESRSRTLAANWSGEAREAYVEAYVRWRHEYQEIIALLEQVTDAVAAASRRYSATERAVEMGWRL